MQELPVIQPTVPRRHRRPAQHRLVRAGDDLPKAARLALGIALVAGGCQSYQPRPLYTAEAHAAWSSRSPADESARAFAERLARAESGGGAGEGGGAAPFDPADGLTLAEAEPVALVFNRELRLARLESGVARALAENAGLWDDPVAGVDIERIISGVPDPWVIGGSLAITIPISGRLEVEKDRASARLAAELQRLAATEWAVRASLREQWIEWSAQSHRLGLATELVERLRVIAELSRRQEGAGVLSRVEARLFDVELAGSEADLIAARARLHELELRLRDVLGLAPHAPVRLIETLAFAARAGAGPWTPESLDGGNLDLAAARAEYDLAEQSLRLEVRRQYPDLVIGPGFGTDEGDDRILLGVQLPLPLWNRNRLNIAEAAAQREAARARFETAYERLAWQLATALASYDAATDMRAAIETGVLPLADQQDEDVRRIAELGRVEPLLLLEAIKSQHSAKVRLVEARAAQAIAAIRIDELIGPPVLSPQISPQLRTDAADTSPQTKTPQTTPPGVRP